MLYKWCKEAQEFGDASFPGNGKQKLTPEQERIKELEKKLAAVELEHEILQSKGYFRNACYEKYANIG
ncbi:transposase [Myroides sp. NP-2]|nr:transposase [Myroides sp. NP-2]